jgi:hypothetical protein
MGSAEYTRGDAVVTAEYSRWHSNQTSDLEPSSSPEAERTYAMFTYRVASWLQPGAYYSLFFPYVDNRWGHNTTPANAATTCSKTACWQHDMAVTLRFDLTVNWLLKLEAHFMDGAAGLSNPLQVGTRPQSAERDWLAFLVKTPGYF